MNCPRCNNTNIQKDGFAKNKKQRYVCKDCKKKFTANTIKIVNCVECGKETNNPRFCSMSCSASFHNRYTKKKAADKLYSYNNCSICNQKTKGFLCINCKSNIGKFQLYKTMLTVTIKDILQGNKVSKRDRVRIYARELWQRLNYPKCCEICGYDKHYEICHIQAISTFSADTKIRVVNAPSNLVALCPNCHWEFDNNKMDIQNINKIEIISKSRYKSYL